MERYAISCSHTHTEHKERERKKRRQLNTTIKRGNSPSDELHEHPLCYFYEDLSISEKASSRHRSLW